MPCPVSKSLEAAQLPSCDPHGKEGKPPSGGGLKQLADEHPDYLFTRVALSTKAQDKDQLEKTAAQLGPTLDIRNLYPQRSLSHVSELRN